LHEVFNYEANQQNMRETLKTKYRSVAKEGMGVKRSPPVWEGFTIVQGEEG